MGEISTFMSFNIGRSTMKVYVFNSRGGNAQNIISGEMFTIGFVRKLVYHMMGACINRKQVE